MRQETSDDHAEPDDGKPCESTTESTAAGSERTGSEGAGNHATGDEDSSNATDQEQQRDSATNDSAGKPPGWRRHIKLPTSRQGKVLLAATLGVILAVAVGAVVWVRSVSLPAGAVFAYGDHVVMQDELDARTQALRALYGVEPPRDPGKQDGFRRDVAKSVAVSMILDHAEAERNIVVADKQARDALDRYVTAQFGEGGRDAFVRSLGNVGTSEPAVIQEIKRQLAVGRLMDQVVGQVSISDGQLRSEFDKRKPQLGAPERRVVRNVVLGSEQEARSVVDQIHAGAPIEEMASQRSLDASTKQSGGMLGELSRDQLEKPVADTAFSVPQGATYGPVKGQFGWNVGRVDRVLAPEPAEFDKVRDSLRKRLQSEESLKRWRDWLGQQIHAADVDYAPDYRPANPDAPPATNTPGTAPPGGGAPGPGTPPR